jgi:hypothetical protein
LGHPIREVDMIIYVVHDLPDEYEIDLRHFG